jgi:hypothetical protein
MCHISPEAKRRMIEDIARRSARPWLLDLRDHPGIITAAIVIL